MRAENRPPRSSARLRWASTPPIIDPQVVGGLQLPFLLLGARGRMMVRVVSKPVLVLVALAAGCLVMAGQTQAQPQSNDAHLLSESFDNLAAGDRKSVV